MAMLVEQEVLAPTLIHLGYPQYLLVYLDILQVAVVAVAGTPAEEAEALERVVRVVTTKILAFLHQFTLVLAVVVQVAREHMAVMEVLDLLLLDT